MKREEKIALTHINKISLFQDVMLKLTTNQALSEEQKTYILSCAIIFLKHYIADNRHTSYAEVCYFIILKYSVHYDDYKPLFDFTSCFGFFPITKTILNQNLINGFGVTDYILQTQLQLFNKDNYTETLHQRNSRARLLADSAPEVGYIAPTSFGKSSVIVDYVRNAEEKCRHVGIIVPTKSLLMQTYRMIKEAKLGRKLIIHDEMFQGEESFIAVLTQERALRLLNKQDVHFDLLFIDEAHNILTDDYRSILLTRLLVKNRLRNPSNKVIYLSPLVEDCKNLMVTQAQNIAEHKIPFNVKEPELFEMRLDGGIYQYNRFVGQHYPLGNSPDMFTYVVSRSKRKNFIYLYSPKKIELFAKELSGFLQNVEMTDELADLIKILRQEVHESFYAIDYIKHGIIYLHAKLPDLIKEYLESKFRDIPSIRYIIANSVILEGMNLPIDCLFILNTFSLGGKELTNLIGRVNRLNTIFTDHGNNLPRLLPQVHFVNSHLYNRKDGQMVKKIELLRSRSFSDDILNPTLANFDIDVFKLKADKKVAKQIEVDRIQTNEEFLNSTPQNEREELKHYLINSGINEFYHDLENLTTMLLAKISQVKGSPSWETMEVLEKIDSLFVERLENIKDYEFRRLSNESARKYYKSHILISQKKSLNENITQMFKFFKSRALSERSKFYFGPTYGEEVYESVAHLNLEMIGKPESETYIDLSKKSDAELINLAIVKLKMEDDFVSFKLNKFIVMLHDFDLISTDDYNTYIYGTTDQQRINLTKIGLSVSLISRLDEDGQLKNIFLDQNNNLSFTKEFETYKSAANDFYRFELNRFLS